MATTRDIRRRIKSVKNTAQITKAMQMVAASKMRKAQQAALGGRPYAALMNEVLAEVTARAKDFRHPLMETRDVRRRAVILVSTDRGLCGALNSNLFREVVKFDRDTTLYVTAGRKASQFIARTKRPLAAEFTYKDTPQFGEARAISRFAQDLFIKREVDAVDILFTQLSFRYWSSGRKSSRFCRWEKSRRSPPESTATRKRGNCRRAAPFPIYLSRMRRRCWANCCRTV